MPVKKKAPIKKPVAEKVVKKVAVEKKVTAPKTVRVSGLSVPVYSLLGRAAGTLALPKEIFGKEVNKKLLAQAVRVYMTNNKQFLGSTKTRGDVEGSTAKIFRQKGTGRARHGGIRAPIFVGGGIALGPKNRKVRLTMPQKMKKAALFQALSVKAAEKQILGISGLEKASGKTKEIVELLKKVKVRSALIVTGDRLENAVRSVKNIPQVDIMSANLINAYEVLRYSMVIITKEAIEKMVNPKETK